MSNADYAPEKIREILEEILSAPDYDYIREETSVFKKYAEELRKIVEEFFAGLNAAHPALYWLIVTLLLALLILLVWHISYTFRTALKEKAMPLPWGRTEPGSPSSRALRRKAEDTAARGRHLEAVRLLLQAAVRLVEERLDCGSLKGRTNREVLGMASRLEGMRAPFKELIHTVEGIWYGRRFAGPDDYELCRRISIELWSHG